MSRRTTGFTIVELLIVIVVIGILAAISIVAYNGIQNRANDTAIQSDLRTLANTIQVYAAENGELPIFGTQVSAGGSINFPGITFKPTRTAYFENENNLFVCRSTDLSDQSFAMAARSKSGTVIAYSSKSGFIPYTTSWPVSTTICPHIGYTSFHFSYGKQVNIWNGWIR